jgi:hypothetical protein
VTTQAADPISPGEFLAAAPASLNGSSPWAARYAVELRRVLLEHAARAPRTLQQHLGPSELGVECDRQVAGKMAALPATNHVLDPWPSMVGTACHAYAADAFTEDNLRSGLLRWVAEQKVTPHPEHPGTADLYDASEQAVVDHKFLGQSSMSKIRKGLIPDLALMALKPRKYVVQLLLYGLGYYLMGLPVKRVVLAAYPRTAATLDGLYVWETSFTDDAGNLLPEVVALLGQVLNVDTPRRRQMANLILNGLPLMQIPAVPDADECYFCPFYRPQAARDSGPGCPGSVAAA